MVDREVYIFDPNRIKGRAPTLKILRNGVSFGASLRRVPVDWFLTGSIAAVMLVALVGGLRRRASTNELSSTLTTLGIFGTFLGVSYALIRFDPGNIQDSVPGLLAGMRTAFLTSVLGVLLAISVRFRLIFPKASSGPGVARGRTLDHVVQSLETQAATLRANGEHLVAIQRSLAGDGDTTLLSQFRLMRQEANDHSRQMLDAFGEFAKQLAENNSKALITALQEVIRDFNTKLNEQFGENFKELNRAVGELVRWQEQYRLQIERQTQLLETVATGTETVKRAFADVQERAVVFSATAGDLKGILETNAQISTDLDARLKAFHEMSVKAGEALPSIEKHLDLLTKEFSRQVIEATSNSLDATKTLRESLERAAAEFQEELRDSHLQNRQLIQAQLRAFDEDLGKALTKSLESLGTQLATLSGHFVKDYQPLTERLRQVVRLAEGGSA